MSSNTTLTDDFRERHSRRMQDAKARRNRPFMRRAEIINYFCGITMIILALPDIYTFNAIRREWQSWTEIYTESLRQGVAKVTNDIFWITISAKEYGPPLAKKEPVEIVPCSRDPEWKRLDRVYDGSTLFSDANLGKLLKQQGNTTTSMEVLRNTFRAFNDCVVIGSSTKWNIDQEKNNILSFLYTSGGLFPREVFPDKLMLLGIESNLRKYTGQPTAGLNHRATILLDPQYIQYAGIHETTHAVLRHHTHSFNWDTLWREKIGPYDTKNPIHYIKASQVTPRWIPRYGMINPKEDAATIAESMFTGVSWKNLRSQMKQSPILTKKVQLLMREFERVSGWLMDEEYFARIEKGKIRNAIEAQAYFQEKRMLPILAVREENIKRVALYTFQVDQVMRHYPLIWKYPTQPESINITPSK